MLGAVLVLVWCMYPRNFKPDDDDDDDYGYHYTRDNHDDDG